MQTSLILVYLDWMLAMHMHCALCEFDRVERVSNESQRVQYERYLDRFAYSCSLFFFSSLHWFIRWFSAKCLWCSFKLYSEFCMLEAHYPIGILLSIKSTGWNYMHLHSLIIIKWNQKHCMGLFYAAVEIFTETHK